MNTRQGSAGWLVCLMALDPTRTNMGARWIRRKDNDFALTWVMAYGEGRVFNTSFGPKTGTTTPSLPRAATSC